jgi:hypothetical protein
MKGLDRPVATTGMLPSINRPRKITSRDNNIYYNNRSRQGQKGK